MMRSDAKRHGANRYPHRRYREPGIPMGTLAIFLNLLIHCGIPFIQS